MARKRSFSVNLGWLLSWLLDKFLRGKLKELFDQIDASLPVTFYFKTKYVSGRIIIDDVEFPEF